MPNASVVACGINDASVDFVLVILQGAKKGAETVKSTNVYKGASYKVQQMLNTDTYKEVANSEAGQFARQLWRELRGQQRLRK